MVRKKRSISMPPDLDTDIEAAASAAGMTYSGWLAEMARKEFMVQAGLDAVDGFERDNGSFTPEELAEAEPGPRGPWSGPIRQEPVGDGPPDGRDLRHGGPYRRRPG